MRKKQMCKMLRSTAEQVERSTNQEGCIKLLHLAQAYCVAGPLELTAVNKIKVIEM